MKSELETHQDWEYEIYVEILHFLGGVLELVLTRAEDSSPKPTRYSKLRIF